MLKTSPILKTTSIHNIIVQDQHTKFNSEIKQFFHPHSYPLIPTTDLKAVINYSTDERFHILVKALEDWNKKLDNEQISNTTLSRSELYRNKFIYTSLKNILLHGSKGSVNYQKTMDKLFVWYKANSQEPAPTYLTVRKKKVKQQDDQFQVRQTYKSNMPAELSNYQRRALFTTEEDIAYLKKIKKREISHQKLVDYSAIKQYQLKQLKQRQQRQQEQLNRSKTLLKCMKSRLEEENCKNIDFFKGAFNLPKKTSASFGKFYDNKHKDEQYKVINRTLGSYSIIDNKKSQFDQIKHYRLNSSVSKQYRRLFEPRNMNTIDLVKQQNLMNKTSKSFVSTFKQTTLGDNDVDVDYNQGDDTLNVQFSSNGFSNGPTNTKRAKKALTLKVQNSKQKTKRNLTAKIVDTKQQVEGQINIQKDLYNLNAPILLKNWAGQRLIPNPFEKKKDLLKKKKKSSAK